MEENYTIKISKDRMSAIIENINKKDSDFSIKPNEFEDFLKKFNVIFGIKQDSFDQFILDPLSISYPFQIAEGVPARHGRDAYLLNELPQDSSLEKEKINFRDVLKIPSVKSGQLLASIIPQTRGINGTDVTGKPIPAKNGKPLNIRAGKNVVLEGTHYYSTIDGQVSITHNMISVNPVFEVKGNIDLRTGNIDFVGNVVIKGDVPTGYEVKAGGDIQILGLVEGASILAEGNIYISGGIAGGNKAKIMAGGDVHAAYINQAQVRAGQDVDVSSSILHSQIEAAGSIKCKDGHVIGGHLISGKDIHIKELGNHSYTKTELHLGWDPTLIKKEKQLTLEKNQLSESLTKLLQIEKKMIEAAKHKGQLSEDHKLMLLKQRTTHAHLQNQLQEIQNQLHEVEEEKKQNMASSLFIYDSVYPNSLIHFGKLSKLIKQKHIYARFYVADGEIVFEPMG